VKSNLSPQHHRVSSARISPADGQGATKRGYGKRGRRANLSIGSDNMGKKIGSSFVVLTSRTRSERKFLEMFP
jgi:hypothetical protein